MKKIFSLLCVFAITLGVYAVPAKQTALQSATKAQAMKIQVPADKAPMGQTIAPLPAKKAAPARKVAAQQAPSVKPQAQKAAAKKAVRRPQGNLATPQRAKKADSTEVREFNVAEAIAAVDAGEVSDGDEIAVHGIITKLEFKGKNFAKYGSVNIYVADANGNEGTFEFYNCYSLAADTFRTSDPEFDASSTAWASFNSVTDGNGITVKVGDEVVALGKFKLYNTTYELNTGCYLIYLKGEEEDPYEGDADVDLNAAYAAVGYYNSGALDNQYYHIIQAYDEQTFCGLYFLTSQPAIEPGVYPIDFSYESGTVAASSSIHNYSLACALTEDGSFTAPYWCMVAGTVTVTEEQIIVSAENTKGHQINATIVNTLPKPAEETVIWEGPVTLDWNSDLVKVDQGTLANVPVGSTISVYYEVVEAEYHSIRITTPLWADNLVEQIDFMEDVASPLRFTYDERCKQIVEQAGAMSVVGFGLDITKITFVAPANSAPTAEDLAGLGFDVENDLVVAFYFDEAVCNDIVFVGTHNGWNIDPASIPHMMPLEGFDGWYVVSVPFEEGAQGKPAQLTNEGEFDWAFQAGDPDAWIHRGGNEAWIVSGYAGEANVYYETPGAYIYEIAYWKNHNTPCTLEKMRVIVGVNVPEGAPEAGVEIIGSFDNWSGTPMQLLETGWWVSFDIEATEIDEFKFREAGTWDNEILVYDADYDWWTAMSNIKFSDVWVDDTYKGEPVKWIELDFSDPNMYRWKSQETPVVPTGDTIVLNFQEPMVGYQYYEDGDWYLVASDGEYEVALDFFNYKSESPAGSYTENDLYAYYSYVAKRVDSIWNSWNVITAQIEVIETNLRVDVQASLLASDGNVYEVTMFREKAVPTREEELIVENAQLDIYSGSWQLRGFNADETRFLSIAAYSAEVAGDYTTGTLATNYCYVVDVINDSTYIWYDMSDAEIHVDYDTESTVATITGWMNAVSQADGEAVQFIITATSAAQPTGKKYDAEDADFIVDFAEYQINEDYAADYGVLFINAINEDNQYITLEVNLPDSATKLVPGVYPISAEGEPQSVTEGTIENGYIYGSFACNLTEEGSVSIPLWLLTSGQVIVNEDGSIRVEAVNSYDRAIQCTLAKRYFPPVEINTCAEAAAAAMTVSENNELFNGGQVFTIQGYVTEISGAWSAQYKNISFWMADEKDGGRVIQAYRAACATQADAPKVGDLIEITGALTRYNSNPEFVAGSTFVIIERDVKRCGDDLIWELEDGVLTIEGTGEMWDYMNEQWGYDITSVNLPEGITSIGISAFAYCQGLKSIKLPSTLLSIKDDAFFYTGLESLDIPANVQYIYAYAFGYCYALTSLRAATNYSLSWSTAAFYGTDNIRNLEAPAWYLRILKGSYLENVRITAGGFSQEAATNLHLSHRTLKKIDLSGLADTYLFDEVLRNCYVLNEVILPQGLETIGFGALAECKTLTSIAIPASVTEIGNSAFEDCRSLIDVQFAPNSKLQRIGNWAFYNCHNLPAIQVPQGVTEIGDGAFYGCVYANELVLPASMVAIGDNAFAFCSKLEKIIVNALLPPAIVEKTFFEVSRETPVYVPDESIQAYKDHIYWGQLNIINTHQGLEGVGAETKAQKIVRDGQVLIIRGERIFTTTGAEIK